MGFNRVMVWLLRSPLHSFLSRSTLVLGVIGVKSGRSYDVPVTYTTVATREGNRLLVTSQRNRTWWRNLRGRVEVDLTFQGKRGTAFAQAFESVEDVAEGLKHYFKASPKSARFFNIQLTADGNVAETDLNRLTEERVVIWVEP